MTAASNSEKEESVLAALQLGWLAVESFGLLRRCAAHGRPPAAKAGAGQRFNFTERTPTLIEQLLISLQRLQVIAAGLAPDDPPPVPPDPLAWVERLRADPQAIERAWAEFEAWSREVWQLLLVHSPLAGQAFACGGDLADTYWHAQGAGAEKLAELLRSYRLRYVAERVQDLAPYLPEHSALAIQHSLAQWSIGEAVKDMDSKSLPRLRVRLEAQAKVWRDLLFRLRQAGSYLTGSDRRLIAWGAAAASAGLVVGVGLVVWLAVLFLAGAGRSLMGAALELPVDPTRLGGDVLAYLSNWQNWSALLATVSAVLAVLTGVVRGLSGWLWAFNRGCRQALTLRQIQYRTYRHVRFRPEEKPAGEEPANP